MVRMWAVRSPPMSSQVKSQFRLLWVALHNRNYAEGPIMRSRPVSVGIPSSQPVGGSPPATLDVSA